MKKIILASLLLSCAAAAHADLIPTPVCTNGQWTVPAPWQITVGNTCKAGDVAPSMINAQYSDKKGLGPYLYIMFGPAQNFPLAITAQGYQPGAGLWVVGGHPTSYPSFGCPSQTNFSNQTAITNCQITAATK